MILHEMLKASEMMLLVVQESAEKITATYPLPVANVSQLIRARGDLNCDLLVLKNLQTHYLVKNRRMPQSLMLLRKLCNEAKFLSN